MVEAFEKSKNKGFKLKKGVILTLIAGGIDFIIAILYISYIVAYIVALVKLEVPVNKMMENEFAGIYLFTIFRSFFYFVFYSLLGIFTLIICLKSPKVYYDNAKIIKVFTIIEVIIAALELLNLRTSTSYGIGMFLITGFCIASAVLRIIGNVKMNEIYKSSSSTPSIQVMPISYLGPQEEIKKEIEDLKQKEENNVKVDNTLSTINDQFFETLEKLNDLKKKGILTETEFVTMKEDAIKRFKKNK